MKLEVARVLCSVCYEEILKEFGEQTLEGWNEKSENCIVFNSSYALCKRHLAELGDKL